MTLYSALTVLLWCRLLRLRNEVDKLLTYQASKIADPEKQRAFLATHYEELLRALSVSF